MATEIPWQDIVNDLVNNFQVKSVSLSVQVSEKKQTINYHIYIEKDKLPND